MLRVVLSGGFLKSFNQGLLTAALACLALQPGVDSVYLSAFAGIGAAFAVSGQGLSDAVEVALVDKKGVRHEVAVEGAKETLLLCGAVSSAAKGAATLEVSVVSSAASGRFTATRRVMVC